MSQEDITKLIMILEARKDVLEDRLIYLYELLEEMKRWKANAVELESTLLTMNMVEADGTAISVESHAKSYRATNIECVQIMHYLSLQTL